ncbi:MAG TPA: hypothetical protein VMW52_05240, partial [Phycisphaerae bacterium]|nr:hypothetical protein [Phycisphaerae bacterium]
IWADRRIDNVWMMSAPLSVGYEAISAIAGFGPYQFLSWSERANKVMGRFNPGPRAIMDLFTAAGLTEDDPERELATKRYWTWVRDNTPPEAQTTWIDAEAATRAFRGNMRRAYNEMRKKQTAETIAKAHEYIEIAVGAKEGDYASAARSIRSRRLLPNIKDEKMEEFKKYMGPELFAALETHDAILDKWASGFTGGGTGGRTGRSASPRTGRTGR